MIAVDATGRLIGGDDIIAQTERVLENVKAVLEAAQAGFEDIVKVTVFLRRIGDRAAVNSVRRRFFAESRPASTLVEVSGLALSGALIEIDVVALVPRT